MIGEDLNFNDNFLRDLTVCVLDTLEGELYWEYRFSSGTKPVVVPVYFSMLGNERFLLDSFTDDITSDNRKTELNISTVPRAVLSWDGCTFEKNAMTNPNVYNKVNVQDKSENKKMLTYVRRIPLTVNYKLSIILNSVNDAFECWRVMMDTLAPYRIMTFQYNLMNVQAAIQLPDSNQFEILTESDMSAKNQIKMNTTLQIKVIYPAYRKPKLEDNTDNKNKTWNNAFSYDDYKLKTDQIIFNPKKSKWYNNINKL